MNIINNFCLFEDYLFIYLLVNKKESYRNIGLYKLLS